MKKIFIFELLTFLCLTACVSTEFNYKKPNDYSRVEVSKTINKPASEVWKTLLSNLSENFFVINTIEKESGIINLSYSGDAEKYVDCGVIDSYIKNLAGERRYVFNVAVPYKRYEIEPAYSIEHSSNLSGRINILVQEKSKGKTKVSVNIKYVVQIQEIAHKLGNDLQLHHTNSSVTYSFNSNEKDSKENGIICTAKGSLEKEILDLVK